MTIEQLLAQARRRAFDQAAQGVGERYKGLRQEPPPADHLEQVGPTSRRPEGYYRLFCAHHKPMWQPCASGSCRRDKQEALGNLERLRRGEL